MRRLAGLLGLLGLVGACAGEEPPPPAPPDLAEPQPPPEPLQLREVDWNSGKAELGSVHGVAELGEDLMVLSDRGAQLFASGRLQAGDVTVRHWRQGGVIAAADLSGQWLAAIDGEGRVRRLRNRSFMDDVSARYGLAEENVQAMAALAGGRVAFLVAGGLQVADVQAGRIARYAKGSWRALAAHGHRVALLGEDRVQLLDLAQKEALDLPAKGARAVAFSEGDGRLLVATATELYGEEGPALRVLDRLAGARGRALAAAAEGGWIADGDRLSLLPAGGARVRTGEADRIPGDAQLIASPGGGVWVLGSGLRRLREEGGAGDRERWERTVLPVYLRRCALCHDPGGSSLIDLSSYAAWTARRALLEQRVVRGQPTPMPPAGTGALTAEELEVVRRWIAGT